MTKLNREQLLEKAVKILEEIPPGQETSKGFCLVCGHEQACFIDDVSAGECGGCRQATVFEAGLLIHLMTSEGTERNGNGH